MLLRDIELFGLWLDENRILVGNSTGHRVATRRDLAVLTTGIGSC